MDERFDSTWKPGGTLLGVYGRWASWVESGGNDRMGRWSWLALRGKGGKMITVISAYRVPQANPSKVGELSACKQQVRSMLKKGVLRPNPKKTFLADIGNS